MQDDQEKKRYDPKRIFRHNILYALILVLAVLAINLWRGAGQVSVIPSSEGITLSAADRTITIPYREITDIRFFEHANYGEAVDGGIQHNWRYGTWKSDTMGTYEAYASTRISACILFVQEDRRIAFTFENDGNTKELYTSIIAAWQAATGKEGYSPISQVADN